MTESTTITTPVPSQANPAFARLHSRLRREQSTRRNSTLAWSWIIRVLVGIALIGGWQLLVSTGIVNEAVASSPGAVLDYLITTVPTAELWINLWSTLQATVIGLVVGSLAGIGLGILLFEVDVLRRGLSPYITFLNSLPRPALAPIFLLWFGLGIGAKISVSISIVVFVLLLNTLAGLHSTDPDHRFLSRSLGMTRFQRLRLIQLPSSVPVMMAGLRLATVYSVLGVVVSELVAAERGLGQMLVVQTNSFNVGGAFGILMILGFLAMALNGVVSLIERRFSWQTS